MKTRKGGILQSTVPLQIRGGPPFVLSHSFPPGGMPPAKILITAGVDEFKIVAIADRRAIDLKVLQENFVLWFLVVASEVVVFGCVMRILRMLHRRDAHATAILELI